MFLSEQRKTSDIFYILYEYQQSIKLENQKTREEQALTQALIF